MTEEKLDIAKMIQHEIFEARLLLSKMKKNNTIKISDADGDYDPINSKGILRAMKIAVEGYIKTLNQEFENL